jgi:hypothetical protein
MDEKISSRHLRIEKKQAQLAAPNSSTPELLDDCQPHQRDPARESAELPITSLLPYIRWGMVLGSNVLI